METFSLLKYWRGGGSGDTAVRSPAIVTTIAHPAATDTDGEDEDGPFIDLEFGVNEEEGAGRENGSDFEVAEVEDDEAAVADSDGEFDFTLSSASGSSCDDGNSYVNLPLSPADDLFFKGRLLPVLESDGGEPFTKQTQFPVSLMKSATKFRVFMLGLKKPRVEKPTVEEKEAAAVRENLFAVKFKVEEVPIKSLFTRENSARSVHRHSQKRTMPAPEEALTTPDDKLFSKEAVHRYLKKVKPLYVRVSRRYVEKLRLSGQVAPSAARRSQIETEVLNVANPAAVTSPRGVQKPITLPVGLREVCKHLGKSRSASSTVPSVSGGSRMDDSLLEQEDGIQGAILHCKRSFNASRESESSMLLRSVSDLLLDKSSNRLPATSSNENKEQCCL